MKILRIADMGARPVLRLAPPDTQPVWDERSNEGVGALLEVAHDLKEPLRSIENITTLLREDLRVGAADTANRLDRLQLAARRLKDLVTQALSVGALGAADNVEAVDVARIVREIAETLCADERGPGPRVRSIGALPTITAPPGALRLLFSNLISNALKHNTSPRPTAYVLYNQQPLRHHFFVVDNGRGVQADPFAGRFLAPSAGVGGLGIRIMRDCLRRLGASASAVPVRVGRGTIVEVAIPHAS